MERLPLFKRARHGVILTLWVFTLLPAQAQLPDFKFDHLTTNEGLPDGHVNDILQDQRGFMWFCTWDGLVRYDGYNFQVYKPDLRDTNSISSKLIYSIAEDRTGGIWVGTTHGLNFFDRKKGIFKHFLHEPHEPQSLLSNWIIDLTVDQQGNLWLATDKGLTCIQLDTVSNPVRFQHFQHSPDNSLSLPRQMVRTIMADQSGYVWAGTLSGLARIDPSGNYYRFPDQQTATGLSDYSIAALYEDESQKVWIGTKQGKSFNGVPKRINLFTRKFPGLLNQSRIIMSLPFAKIFKGIYGLGCLMEASRSGKEMGNMNTYNTIRLILPASMEMPSDLYIKIDPVFYG